MADDFDSAVRALEQSRARLVRTFADANAGSPRTAQTSAARDGQQSSARTFAADESKFGKVKNAVREAWEDSPGPAVASTLEPQIKQAIRRSPWAAVGIAAASGALLISSGALRSLLVRTSGKMAWRMLGTTAIVSLVWSLAELDTPRAADDEIDDVN